MTETGTARWLAWELFQKDGVLTAAVRSVPQSLGASEKHFTFLFPSKTQPRCGSSHYPRTLPSALPLGAGPLCDPTVSILHS